MGAWDVARLAEAVAGAHRLPVHLEDADAGRSADRAQVAQAQDGPYQPAQSGPAVSAAELYRRAVGRSAERSFEAQAAGVEQWPLAQPDAAARAEAAEPQQQSGLAEAEWAWPQPPREAVGALDAPEAQRVSQEQ